MKFKIIFFFVFSFTFINIIQADHFKTLDSLIQVSESGVKLDSLYFDAYRKALTRIPSTEQKRRIIYSEKGLSLAGSAKLVNNQADIAQNLALFYGSIDSIKLARRFSTYAFDITTNLSSKARYYASWVAIYSYFLDDYQTAIKYYNHQIEISKSIGQEELASTAYINMAEIFMDLKQYQLAKKYALKGLEIENPKSLAKKFYFPNVVGQTYEYNNQLDSALYYYQQSLSITKNKKIATSATYFIAFRNNAYYNISKFYLKQNQPKLALIYADSSVMDIDKISAPSFDLFIKAHSNLAQCYLALERIDEAQEAISHIDNKMSGGKTFYALKKAYFDYKIAHAVKVGNYQKALEYTDKLNIAQSKLYEMRDNFFTKIISDASNDTQEAASASIEELNRKYKTTRTLSIVFAIVAFLLLILYIKK